MNFDEVRAQFPATNDTVYLAANWKSPLPNTVAEKIHDVIDGYSNRPYDTILQGIASMQPTREKVAALIGANADEVAFGRSTAEGLIWLATSFPWQEGDEVIIPKDQYPTLSYPFLAQEKNGVVVKRPAQDDWRITPEIIENAITGRTKFVVVSWPQFDNGQRPDLEGIARVCRRHNVYFVVDAIQSLGSFRINVAELGIDCLVSATYKWIFALPGLSVFYCRRELLSQFQHVHVGFLSMEEGLDSEIAAEPLKLDPAKGARRFEEGIHNYAGVAALSAAVDFINSIGVENIENRIKEISDYLCEQVTKKGCEIVSRRDNDQWSGIVLIRLPSQDPYQLYEKLHAHGVYVYAFRGCLVVGVGVYNNRGDIDKLLAYIE